MILKHNLMKLSKIFMILICIATAGLQTVSAQTSIKVGAVEVTDTDGDGVVDNLDEYPKDALKAFNNYSSTGAGASVAFEDQWPLIGDFDVNDMVVDYKYNVVTNARNRVVQVIADYSLRAAGGDFVNGFGVEFPISAKTVSSLTGATFEAGQEKAVIILFTNMHTEIETRNTDPDVAYSAPKTYHVSFDVADGPTLNDFGLDYNPFLFTMVGESRREVHLVGKLPTNLADKTLFGTGDDNTNAALGRYYITKNGFPYAISVPLTSFSYPKERKDIGQAYTHFADWALSGGKAYQDWYSNSSDSYRNQSLLYGK
jgi:LruC domain-containing protein